MVGTVQLTKNLLMNQVANVLLDHQADLTSSTKKGFTPLHLAAKYGNMKVTRLLLQRGADPDSEGKNGVTPLHVAAHYDHQNVAVLLLDKVLYCNISLMNHYNKHDQLYNKTFFKVKLLYLGIYYKFFNKIVVTSKYSSLCLP